MADSTYIGLGDLNTPEKLSDKRQDLETQRNVDVKEWALNRAFYRGNQWCYYDPTIGQAMQLPTDENLPRWKVRLVSDQISGGTQHYIAQMTKTWPTIYATPDSADDRDRKASEMATALFEHWQEEFHLRGKLHSALTHAQISQGYWKITWDPYARSSMRMMVNPEDGQLITNDEIADLFREKITEFARQAGQDPQKVLSEFEKVIYLGDIKIEVLPGENVLVDPTVASFEDAKFVICKHAMDPMEVKARYKIDVEPDSMPADTELSSYFAVTNKETTRTTKNLFIGYFKPTPGMPKGRYVVWIEDPYKILVDEDWPFPFEELPLIKFPGIERPDSPTDDARITQARPLQKELNRLISQISEYKNLTLKPQMIAPIGSLRQRLTSEPGAVFEYQPIGGLAPEWRPVPNLPSYTFNMLGDIQQRIDRIFNRMPNARDQLPARLDSGISIEMIQESVADQMSTEIQRMEDALARAGMMMAKLAQRYYIEPRLVKIKGAGGSIQAKKFMNVDLMGGFTFRAEAGTGLPRSRAGKQTRILELMDKGVLPPDKGMKFLDLADLKGINAEMQADEEQAYREHDKLLRGEPISQLAMHQVMEAANTGQIPADQIQQAFQQAMITPSIAVNASEHVRVHRSLIMSPEFEAYPMDAQQRFIMHFQMEQQMATEQAQTDPKLLPKMSITARATTSAKVMAAILAAQGIKVTPEEVAEEPLETAVYDSVDKPDQDSAANDAMSAHEMFIAEDLHQAEMMKAQAEMIKAQGTLQADEGKNTRAQQQHDLKMLQMAHESELSGSKHEDDARRAEELHKEKLVQMRKPKPKPSGGK